MVPDSWFDKEIIMAQKIAKPTRAALASLHTIVQDQLLAEYHDPARAAHEFENMTAARLLEILSYTLVD